MGARRKTTNNGPSKNPGRSPGKSPVRKNRDITSAKRTNASRNGRDNYNNNRPDTAKNSIRKKKDDADYEQRLRQLEDVDPGGEAEAEEDDSTEKKPRRKKKNKDDVDPRRRKNVAKVAGKPGFTKDLSNELGRQKRRPETVQPSTSESKKTYHSQGRSPEFKKDTSGKPVKPINTDNTTCFTHGIHVDHVVDAVDSGAFRSGYNRNGEPVPGEKKTVRTKDVTRGGYTALYTRAVGTDQTDTPASGSSVRSGDGSVQAIMDTDILDDGHEWRSSSTDLDGGIPGGTNVKEKQQPNESYIDHTRKKWEQQTERDRNAVYNSSIEGTKSKQHNEQAHWEKVETKGKVKALVGTQESVDQMAADFKEKKYIVEDQEIVQKDGSIVKNKVVKNQDGSKVTTLVTRKDGDKLHDLLRKNDLIDENKKLK